MIIAWVIGFILSVLGILLLKNSRKTKRWDNPVGGEPVLRLWALILLIIGAISPIINIFVGVFVTIWCAISHAEKDWEFVKSYEKLVQFLNKPIK